MDFKKTDIIKKFLASGYQLDFAGLDYFYKNQDKIENFLQNAKKQKIGRTVTIKAVESLLNKRTANVLKIFNTKSGRVSVKDQAEYFLKRYEFFKQLFLESHQINNPISINKIQNKMKDFSLIAAVKDKRGAYLTVEDPTGECQVFCPEDLTKEIVLDEIVCMNCQNMDRLEATSIEWPDVPLNRKVNKADSEAICVFVSDLHVDDQAAKERLEKLMSWAENNKGAFVYFFILDRISSGKENIEFLNRLPSNSYKIVFADSNAQNDVGDLELNGPAMIQLEGNITCLVCNNQVLSKYLDKLGGPPVKTMLCLLKKRILDPTFEGRLYEQDPVLETVPDIFVCSGTGVAGEMNYKGTTIISTGDMSTQPIFWVTDLKTRETIKLDLT